MRGQRPNVEIFVKDLTMKTTFPPKYSEDDWLYNTKNKFRMSLENQRLSERVVQNSRLVIQESLEIADNWKREVDHHLKERMSEIRFLIDELKKQKKNVMLEEEALNTFKDRVINAIEFLKEKSLNVCQQCFILREGRIGVDLCDDEVDRQLRQEMKVITGCQSLVNRLLRETKEQLRELRAAMYLLDQDLEFKDKALIIDDKNIKLKASGVDERAADVLHNYACKFSLREWESKTYYNIQQNAKQIVSAGQLRAYIDLLLKQVIEDLINQTERTNEAFVRRLEELKEVKAKLEIRQRDVAEHADYVQNNIVVLETELATKNRGLALCQTRLENRSYRPGLELTCDIVQDSLYAERKALIASICKFKEKIIENKAMFRYLLSVQMTLAEEINIKANSIKIDEVDCMLLREQLHYQTF